MFTKGEWTTRIGFIDCGDKVIADTFSGRKISVAESRANAQLIASAPDLYENLKNLVSRIDQGLALGQELDLKPAREALSRVGRLRLPHKLRIQNDVPQDTRGYRKEA